jgi:hypothetical protein
MNQPPQIDPFSQALGRIEQKVDDLVKYVDARFAAVDEKLDAFRTYVDTRFAWTDRLLYLVLGGVVTTLVAVLLRRGS